MSDSSCLAMILVALAVGGCARNRNDPAPSTTPVSVLRPDAQGTDAGKIVTPVDGLVGRVSAANTNLKFAVITFPVGKMANEGQRLAVYRDGLKVGELVVTGPRSDDSTVADIISGDARIEDEVRDR